MVNIIYPNDFKDYSDGVTIEDGRINKWIRRCIKTIQVKNIDSSYIASGNTIVIVLRLIDFYKVIISQDYQTKEIFNVEDLNSDEDITVVDFRTDEKYLCHSNNEKVFLYGVHDHSGDGDLVVDINEFRKYFLIKE